MMNRHFFLLDNYVCTLSKVPCGGISNNFRTQSFTLYCYVIEIKIKKVLKILLQEKVYNVLKSSYIMDPTNGGEIVITENLGNLFNLTTLGTLIFISSIFYDFYSHFIHHNNESITETFTNGLSLTKSYSFFHDWLIITHKLFLLKSITL